MATYYKQILAADTFSGVASDPFMFAFNDLTDGVSGSTKVSGRAYVEGDTSKAVQFDGVFGGNTGLTNQVWFKQDGSIDTSRSTSSFFASLKLTASSNGFLVGNTSGIVLEYWVSGGNLNNPRVYVPKLSAYSANCPVAVPDIVKYEFPSRNVAYPYSNNAYGFNYTIRSKDAKFTKAAGNDGPVAGKFKIESFDPIDPSVTSVFSGKILGIDPATSDSNYDYLITQWYKDGAWRVNYTTGKILVELNPSAAGIKVPSSSTSEKYRTVLSFPYGWRESNMGITDQNDGNKFIQDTSFLNLAAEIAPFGDASMTPDPDPVVAPFVINEQQFTDFGGSFVVNVIDDTATSGSSPWDLTSLLCADANGVFQGGSFVVPFGTITVNGDGTFSFVPNTGFSGEIVIPFKISNAEGAESNVANATLTVNPEPVAPTANPDAVTIGFRSDTIIPIKDNDTFGSSPFDNLSVEIRELAGLWVKSITLPEGSFNALTDGTVGFTHSPDFFGTVPAIEYRIANSQGLYSNAATINVTVTAPVAPTVINHVTETGFNAVVTVNVLTGSSQGSAPIDHSGTEILVNGAWVRTLSDGDITVSIDNTSNIIITPSGFSGSKSLTYRVKNSHGVYSEPATIALTVTAPVAPTVINHVLETDFGISVTVNVLTGSSQGSAPIDHNGTEILVNEAWVRSSSDSQANISINTSSGIIISPLNFSGDKVVTYRVKNSHGVYSEPATITLTVLPAIAPGEVGPNGNWENAAPLGALEWKLFNTVTGDIIMDIEAVEDDVKLDINGTDTASLTLPISSLTEQQQASWSKLFNNRYDRGIALVKHDSFGIMSGVLSAGPILKRDKKTAEDSIWVQAGSPLDYFARCLPVWIDSVGDPNAVTTFTADSWAGVLNALVASAMAGGPGVNTYQTITTQPFSGTGKTFTYEHKKLWSLHECLTYVRDQLSGDPSTEFRFIPKLTDGKIGWDFVTGSSTSPQINAKETVTVGLFETDAYQWEPVSWDISDDNSSIYNKLFIDGSENDTTVFISSVDNHGTDLTLVETFRAGVGLTAEQMQEQLQARIKNSMLSKKDTSLVIANDEQLVFIGHLGKMARMLAGPRTSGTGTTQRIVELAFSSKGYDTNLNLSLMEPAARYPKLPAQKKNDATGDVNYDSGAGFDMPAMDYSAPAVNGGDLKVEDFDADMPAGSTVGGVTTPPITGAAANSPEKPELKPKEAAGFEDTDLTLFNFTPSPAVLKAHTPYVAKSDVLEGNIVDTYIEGYFSSQPGGMDANVRGNDPGGQFKYPFNTDRSTYTQKIDILTEKIKYIKPSDNSPSVVKGKVTVKIGELDVGWITQQVTDWFAPTAPWVYVNYGNEVSYYPNNLSLNDIWLDVRIIPSPVDLNRLYFSVIINGGYYGGSVYGYYVNEVREVFFTAVRSGNSLIEFEKLISPAEQLLSYGSNVALSFGNDRAAGSGVTASDYYIIEGNRVLFPYTSVRVSKYEAETRNFGNLPLIDMAIAKGLDENITRKNFGMLEADFTNKQPLFKESSIQFPILRVIHSENITAAVYGNSSSDIRLVQNIDKPGWWGHNSVQAFGGYVFTATSTMWGMVVSAYWDIGLDQLRDFYQIDITDEEAVKNWRETYLNKIWVMFRGQDKFTEIKLPTTFNEGNQQSVFGVAYADDSVLTMYSGGETSSTKGMTQAGSVIKTLTSSVWSADSVALAWPYSSHNILSYEPNLIPLAESSSDNGSPVSAVSFGPSPYRVAPADVMSVSMATTKQGLWRDQLVNGVDIPYNGTGQFGEPINTNPYFIPMESAPYNFKQVGEAFRTRIGLTIEGYAYYWGVKPSVTAVPVKEDANHVPALLAPTSRKFEAVNITAKPKGVNPDTFPVHIIGVDTNGGVAYAGCAFSAMPEAMTSAGSDVFIDYSAAVLDNKKMVNAKAAASVVYLVDDSLSLYILQGGSNVVKVDNELINGKIADMDCLGNSDAVVVLTAAGKVYARGMIAGSTFSDITEVNKPASVNKFVTVSVRWDDNNGNNNVIYAIDDNGQVWSYFNSAWTSEPYDYNAYRFKKLATSRSPELFGSRASLAYAEERAGLISAEKTLHRLYTGSTLPAYKGTNVVFGGEQSPDKLIADSSVSNGEGGYVQPGAGGGARAGKGSYKDYLPLIK